MPRPWMDEYDIREARHKASQARQARLRAAREKGTHTKQEWKVLHDLFGRCVACGVACADLVGGEAIKDHIVPIVIGGCDCLANLQPACRHCNSRGIFEDLRGVTLPGWQTIFLHRMGVYF